MNPALAFGYQEPIRPVVVRKPKRNETDEPQLDFGEPLDGLCTRLLHPSPRADTAKREPPRSRP